MKKFLLIVAAGAGIGALGGLIYDKVMRKFNTEELIEDVEELVNKEKDLEDEVDDTEDDVNTDDDTSEDDVNIIFTNYETMITSVQWYDNPKHIISFIDFQEIESNTSNKDLLEIFSSDIEKERLFTAILNKAKGFDTYFSDIIINGFYPEESIMIKRKNGKKKAKDLGSITIPNYIVQKVLEKKFREDYVFFKNILESSIKNFFTEDVKEIDFSEYDFNKYEGKDEKIIKIMQYKDSSKMNFFDALMFVNEKNFIDETKFQMITTELITNNFIEALASKTSKLVGVSEISPENMEIIDRLIEKDIETSHRYRNQLHIELEVIKDDFENGIPVCWDV